MFLHFTRRLMAVRAMLYEIAAKRVAPSEQLLDWRRHSRMRGFFWADRRLHLFTLSAIFDENNHSDQVQRA